MLRPPRMWMPAPEVVTPACVRSRSPTSWTGRFSMFSEVTRDSELVRSRRTSSAFATTVTSSPSKLSAPSSKSTWLVRSTLTRTPVTVVGAKPTNDAVRSYEPGRTPMMRNSPSTFVEAPVVVPSMRTFAPGSVSPVWPSRTTPEIWPVVWAAAAGARARAASAARA